MINLRALGYLTLCSAISIAAACNSNDDDDDIAGSGGETQAGSTHGDAGSVQGGHANAGEASSGGDAAARAGAGQGGAPDSNAGAGGVGGSGGDAALAALSDAQILLVLDTLNQGEVEEAFAVLPRLAAAEVEAFAQLMVTHHGAARQSVAMTAAMLEQAPAPSETQAGLKDQAEAAVAQLRATPTANLDAAYLELQVGAHAEALALLTELSEVADAAELATLLTGLKATVQQHYDRALELEGGL
jgi:uncharacterized protein (DUF305 family)